MSRRRQPDASQLVAACFSRHPEALAWVQERLTAAFGPVSSCSPDFDFHHTDYYAKTMGAGLKKRLIVFESLRPADVLPEIKNFTIGLESELAASGRYPEARPLNIDPGLLQLGKFMLASTKDQGHRIYLQDGIYAEVTLRFEHAAFVANPWTYADYREPDLQAFLLEARTKLYLRLRS